MYTEAYLYDPTISCEIEDFALRLEEIVQEKCFELPPSVDLVLELEDIPVEDRHRHTDWDTGEQCVHHWTYYYANHEERVLFWVEPYEIIDNSGEFNGIEQVMRVQSETHISELPQSNIAQF